MKRLVIFLAVFMLFMASNSIAQIIFGPPTSYSVEGFPASIFASDLDGDGDNDLMTANSDPSELSDISILRNNGDGTFYPAVHYGVGGASLSLSIFASDLDSDGDKDLAVANDVSHNVSILPNNGDGTFQVIGRNYAVGWGPNSVFASDLDGDGDNDLVTANRFVGEARDISVLINNVDGTFHAAVHYGVGGLSQPTSVFASDLDGDGDNDLAVANDISFNVSILPNNGDGTFQVIGRNYDIGLMTPYCIFASDLDGDGDKDLAVANGYSNNVSFLENNGNATFQMPVNYAIGLGPRSVFAADLDGDGDKDLATANSSSDNISILLNQSIITGVDNSPEMLLPESFNISQNYPNPFNNSTVIKYSIPQEGLVTLNVYNIIGEEVAKLVNETKQTGHYEVSFDATGLPSGIYFYRLQAGNYVETKKMVLMK